MINNQQSVLTRRSGSKVLWFEPSVPKEVLNVTPLTQRDFVIRLYGMWSALDAIVRGKRGTDRAARETWDYARRLHDCHASYQLRHGRMLVHKRSTTGGTFIPHCQCQACPVGAADRLLRKRGLFIEEVIRRGPRLLLITFTHQTITAKSMSARRVWRSMDRLISRMRNVLPLLKNSVSGGVWTWEIDRGRSRGNGVVRIHAHALVELEDYDDKWLSALDEHWAASAEGEESRRVRPTPAGRHPNDIENMLYYVRGFRGFEDRHSKILTGFRLSRWGKESRFFPEEREKWLRHGATFPDQLYLILAGYAWASQKENRLQPWFGCWHGNSKAVRQRS